MRPTLVTPFMQSDKDIILRKVGEPEFNSLPRGVVLIMVGDKPIFAKKNGVRFIPLPAEEQKALKEKHINAGG